MKNAEWDNKNVSVLLRSYNLLIMYLLYIAEQFILLYWDIDL